MLKIRFLKNLSRSSNMVLLLRKAVSTITKVNKTTKWSSRTSCPMVQSFAYKPRSLCLRSTSRRIMKTRNRWPRNLKSSFNHQRNRRSSQSRLWHDSARTRRNPKTRCLTRQCTTKRPQRMCSRTAAPIACPRSSKKKTYRWICPACTIPIVKAKGRPKNWMFTRHAFDLPCQVRRNRRR